MCGVAQISRIPSLSATRAISTLSSRSRAPSSSPGRMWQWRSITACSMAAVDSTARLSFASVVCVRMARDLKLGLNTGYWSAGPPPGVEDAIAEADKLGFDSIWTAEAYGSDVLTPLAWWGSQTQNVRLGTAIMQMSARQPAAAAMAAMTMDHLSGGRFILGLGVSGPQVVEGWYGMPFEKPLARTREYVKIVRDIIAREGPVAN